jgi:hypothetical protein
MLLQKRRVSSLSMILFQVISCLLTLIFMFFFRPSTYDPPLFFFVIKRCLDHLFSLFIF